MDILCIFVELYMNKLCLFFHVNLYLFFAPKWLVGTIQLSVWNWSLFDEVNCSFSNESVYFYMVLLNFEWSVACYGI